MARADCEVMITALTIWCVLLSITYVPLVTGYQHYLIRRRGNVRCTHRFMIEPRDIWIGVYWKRYHRAADVYVCWIPCLCAHYYIQWG